MNEESFKRLEEKIDFLIFMQSKTVTIPGALAGQRPKIHVLPGEVLFNQWKESKVKIAGIKKDLQENGKPVPDENNNQTST